MTKRLLLWLLAAMAAIGVMPAAAAAQAQRDWTRTVAMTPEGGFRMGNPAAKVKLVEYASMTCPHCAEFSVAAKQPLMAYVRSGNVSFELRNYVLNGLDVAATLVARCAGPTGFFRLTDSLFAAQRSWAGKVNGLSDAQLQQLSALPEGQRLVRLGEVMGLASFAAQAGLPAPRVRQCLGDSAGLQRVVAMADAAIAAGVQGTPTFFLNGQMLRVNTWTEVEPLIRQAGG
jgi:protein-disulfide isomerase